jgi:hypothetical protein
MTQKLLENILTKQTDISQKISKICQKKIQFFLQLFSKFLYKNKIIIQRKFYYRI